MADHEKVCEPDDPYCNSLQHSLDDMTEAITSEIKSQTEVIRQSKDEIVEVLEEMKNKNGNS